MGVSVGRAREEKGGAWLLAGTVLAVSQLAAELLPGVLAPVQVMEGR